MNLYNPVRPPAPFPFSGSNSLMPSVSASNSGLNAWGHTSSSNVMTSGGQGMSSIHHQPHSSLQRNISMSNAASKPTSIGMGGDNALATAIAYGNFDRYNGPYALHSNYGINQQLNKGRSVPSTSMKMGSQQQYADGNHCDQYPYPSGGWGFQTTNGFVDHVRGEPSEILRNRSGYSKSGFRGPQTTMPKFDGKNTKWKAFIGQFEQLARRYDWHEEKADRLSECLAGPALDLYFSLPLEIRDDYCKVKEKLAVIYQERVDPSASQFTLMRTFQDRGES